MQRERSSRTECSTTRSESAAGGPSSSVAVRFCLTLENKVSEQQQQPHNADLRTVVHCNFKYSTRRFLVEATDFLIGSRSHDQDSVTCNWKTSLQRDTRTAAVLGETDSTEICQNVMTFAWSQICLHANVHLVDNGFASFPPGYLKFSQKETMWYTFKKTHCFTCWGGLEI